MHAMHTRPGSSRQPRPANRRRLTALLACLLAVGIGLLPANPAGLAHGASSLAQTPSAPTPAPQTPSPPQATPQTPAGAPAGQQPPAVPFTAEDLRVLEQRTEGLQLRREGYDRLRAGDPAGAIERFEQAGALFRAVGDRANEAHTMDDTATAYHRDGQYARSHALFEQVLTIGQALGDRQLQQGALLGLGMVDRTLSNYVPALAAYEGSLRLVREMTQEARAAGAGGQVVVQLIGEYSTLSNIGGVHRRRGDYARALETFQQGLTIARALDPRTGSPLLPAEPGSFSTEVLIETSLDAQGTLLDQIGQVYDGLGEYARALEFAQQSLAIFRELDRPRDLLIGLSNTAAAYDELEQFEEARELHEEALALARRMNSRPELKSALNNLSVNQRNRGEYDRALDTLQQVLVLARELGDRAGEAVALGNIGAVHDNLGQHAQAIDFHRQAAAIVHDLGDVATEATLLSNLGDSHEQLGDLPQALVHYREALAINDDVRAAARIEEFKTSLSARTATLYARAVLLLQRLGQSAEAFDLAERARARTFLDQLGNTRLDVTRGDPRLVQQEEALRTEIGTLDRNLRQEQARPADERSGERLASLGADLAVRQAAYADLVAQLKLADPEAASLVSVAPLTLAELQAILPPDTTLLSYFVTPDKTLAFVVGRDRFQAVELPVGDAALRAAIAEFRAFPDPTDVRPASLQQLADWLLAPVAPALTTPTIGIVPHGILHYLPFAALPTPSSSISGTPLTGGPTSPPNGAPATGSPSSAGEPQSSVPPSIGGPGGQGGLGYFGDAHTLFYLPSGSALPFIQAKRRPEPGNVLALAQSRPEGLPPLRFADVEAEAVAGLYGAPALLGAAATESAFRAQAPSARIVHVAAHGELNGAQPLFSRLFLGADGAHDGSLTVQDVYSLDLANANLVVLSACETQLGAQSRGDDLVGLNRAFIYAGAPSVIASLWSVNDPASAVLMTAFHRHLHAGLSKAAALQAAQAETRQSYPHPYYWAAFVLTGDPG